MEPGRYEQKGARGLRLLAGAFSSIAWGLKLVVFVAALAFVLVGVLNRNAFSILVGALLMLLSSLGFYTHSYGRKSPE